MDLKRPLHGSGQFVRRRLSCDGANIDSWHPPPGRAFPSVPLYRAEGVQGGVGSFLWPKRFLREAELGLLLLCAVERRKLGSLEADEPPSREEEGTTLGDYALGCWAARFHS